MTRFIALLAAALTLMAAAAEAAPLHLVRVVIVTRHGVRPPTQSNDELAKFADKPWPNDYLRIADAQKFATGAGVTVAVIDTGVNGSPRVPALPGALDHGEHGDMARGTDGSQYPRPS